MFAVNASAARVASSARARASPARGRHIPSFGSVRTAPAPSRGAALRLRAAKNNPNFDPNDPMTWGTPAEGSDEAFFEEFAAPVEDLGGSATSSSANSSAPRAPPSPSCSTTPPPPPGPRTTSPTPPSPSTSLREPPQAIDKGLALYKNGDYPEALAAFTSALSTSPAPAPCGPERRARDARGALPGLRRRLSLSTSRSPFTTTARAATPAWTTPRAVWCRWFAPWRLATTITKMFEPTRTLRLSAPTAFRGDHGEVRAEGGHRGGFLDAQ